MNRRKHNAGPPKDLRKKPAIDEARKPVDVGPLDRFIGYNLRQAQAAAFRDLARLSRPLRLSAGEYGLLVLIARNTGISSIEVSRFYGLAKSALTPVIAALLRRGLVRRVRTSRDRRVYCLSVTEHGSNALRRMQKAVDRQEANIAAALDTGEGEKLIAMLRRITTTLRATKSSRRAAPAAEAPRKPRQSRWR